MVGVTSDTFWINNPTLQTFIGQLYPCDSSRAMSFMHFNYFPKNNFRLGECLLHLLSKNSFQKEWAHLAPCKKPTNHDRAKGYCHDVWMANLQGQVASPSLTCATVSILVEQKLVSHWPSTVWRFLYIALYKWMWLGTNIMIVLSAQIYPSCKYTVYVLYIYCQGISWVHCMHNY